MTKSVNHFLTSLPTNLFTFKPAFTLAEVLITLGIIGIVAAMTIPTLIQKNFEKQTVTKLRETQSILAQTLRMAEEEYGDPTGWGIKNDEASAIKIANYLKPFFKIATDCGTKDTKYACVTKNSYKQLSGTNHGEYAISRSDCYKIALLNGSSIWWRGPYSNEIPDKMITFWIDVNGKTQPNVYGKDLFVFVYEKNSIRPLGAPDSDSPWKTHCTLKSTGWGCAYLLLQNQNMNYLHNK